jgi:hypothetical protein
MRFGPTATIGCRQASLREKLDTQLIPHVGEDLAAVHPPNSLSRRGADLR